tara:strand:- start:11284 stop:11940 length:657 start_codon:yes stop_codon:yes gene_type:complete
MILSSIENHEFTLIILHGMYQSNKSYIELAESIQKFYKNIKIIIPCAPKRNISWSFPSEKNVSSWYDYYTKNDGLLIHDIINENEYHEQCDRINLIIKNETMVIDLKKIIVMGISQGGTLALNIGLHSNFKLGGIIGIHTLFLNIISTKNINKIPIFLFSGDNDDIYSIELQKKSLEKLQKKLTIKWEIDRNLGHCKFSVKELPFIINSIEEIVLSNS